MDALPLLVGGALVFLLFFLLHWTWTAFRDAGLTGLEAALLVFAAPVASGLNVGLVERGNVVLAVNVAGVLVPAIVAAKIVLQERAPKWRTALAVALVAAATYRTSTFVPDEGVLVPVLVPVASAALLGILLTWGAWTTAPLVAYVAGSLGVLVGADLLRVPEILASAPRERTVMSIGGAGTLDAIFLCAVAAIALQMLLFALFGKKTRARKAARRT